MDSGLIVDQMKGVRVPYRPQKQGKMNYTFITTRLVVGSMAFDRTHAGQLEQIGITHVVNCTPDNTKEIYDRTNIKYFQIPQNDDGKEKPTAWFARGIDIILAALREPRAKVYVHCQAGISRSPSIVYAALVAMGLNKTEVLMRIERLRPIAVITYMPDANRALKELGFI